MGLFLEIPFETIGVGEELDFSAVPIEDADAVVRIKSGYQIASYVSNSFEVSRGYETGYACDCESHGDESYLTSCQTTSKVGFR
jgi:hypothetical protein